MGSGVRKPSPAPCVCPRSVPREDCSCRSGHSFPQGQVLCESSWKDALSRRSPLPPQAIIPAGRLSQALGQTLCVRGRQLGRSGLSPEGCHADAQRRPALPTQSGDKDIPSGRHSLQEPCLLEPLGGWGGLQPLSRH